VIVTIDSKRRLTVPTAVAPTNPGECFDAQFDSEEDAIVFRRLGTKTDWLTVMKKCPVPMDDLPVRRREFPRRRKDEPTIPLEEVKRRLKKHAALRR